MSESKGVPANTVCSLFVTDPKHDWQNCSECQVLYQPLKEEQDRIKEFFNSGDAMEDDEEEDAKSKRVKRSVKKCLEIKFRFGDCSTEEELTHVLKTATGKKLEEFNLRFMLAEQAYRRKQMPVWRVMS